MLGWAIVVIKRKVCEVAGHDYSWTLAAALGHPRPVCERCLNVYPENPKRRDAPDLRS